MKSFTSLLPLLLVCVLGSGAVSTARAEHASSAISLGTNSQPTYINSDFMEADLNDRHATFRGHVTVKDTKFAMSADEMVVYFMKTTNGVDNIHAKGNVKIDQPDQTIAAGEAIYHVSDNKILFQGVPRPKVINKANGTTMEGTSITYWRDTGKLEIDGGTSLQLLSGGNGLSVGGSGEKTDKPEKKKKDSVAPAPAEDGTGTVAPAPSTGGTALPGQ